jgi:uncharacterized membrane protein
MRLAWFFTRSFHGWAFPVIFILSFFGMFVIFVVVALIAYARAVLGDERGGWPELTAHIANQVATGHRGNLLKEFVYSLFSHARR